MLIDESIHLLQMNSKNMLRGRENKLKKHIRRFLTPYIFNNGTASDQIGHFRIPFIFVLVSRRKLKMVGKFQWAATFFLMKFFSIGFLHVFVLKMEKNYERSF
jgi:hypothetical protein